LAFRVSATASAFPELALGAPEWAMVLVSVTPSAVVLRSESGLALASDHLVRSC
jgi:hypothetical protein